METEEPSGRRPTPEEARAALQAAQSAQTDAAAALRPPWWYFASLAALVAVSPLATQLPSTVAGITAFIVFMLLWLTAFGMTLRLFISRAGLVPRFSREQTRRVWLGMIAVGALGTAAAVLKLGFDQNWAMIAFAETLAVAIIVIGLASSRRASA